MKKTEVCTTWGGSGKVPPGALSDAELEHLLGAFCEGKTMILEDECLVLVQWAQTIRLGGVALQMVLDGELTPSVQGTEVRLARRQRPAEV